nr:MAG TPA: hypothetical protein [Caudoviricetes sp.]
MYESVCFLIIPFCRRLIVRFCSLIIILNTMIIKISAI